METEDDGTCAAPEVGVQTVVTPSPGVTIRSVRGRESPTGTINLGANHQDHSDAEDTSSIEEAPPTKKPKPFPTTLFTIVPSTYKEEDLPITNISLPLSKLIQFLDASFKCRKCSQSTKKKFSIERYGIAMSMYYTCMECGLSTCCRADLSSELEEVWSKKSPREKFKNTTKEGVKVNGSDFCLNRKLYLATQVCGGGLTEGKLIAGVLGFHTNALRGRWRDIATFIGLMIIELGQEVLDTNMDIEMQCSKWNAILEMFMIAACGDCRWDKRSSGRTYNSISGCSVLIGCENQLCLGIEPMSNTCTKCAKDVAHDPDTCPKNVDCTSKAMESIGSSKIVHRIFNNYDAYVYEYVGNDDSSTKKVLRHSWADEKAARIIDDVPRNKNGTKKPDNGLLPIEHPSIIWLADKGHRVRQFATKLYKLAAKKKADCEGTSLDAERIKRNLSYAIRVNCGNEEVATLKTAVESVLEHHFGNHTLCGDWCQVKGLEGEALEEAKLKYRCKEKNNSFYLQVKVIFDEFYGGLHEMMHKWDTNIVEGLNKFFTKFLPKDRTLAMTIENKVRLYLAICIDSIGYYETYRRLSEKTGIRYCKVQQTLNEQLDNEKSYRRQYRKLTKTKLVRMKTYYANMTKRKNKLIEENRRESKRPAIRKRCSRSFCRGPYSQYLQQQGRKKTNKQTQQRKGSRSDMPEVWDQGSHKNKFAFLFDEQRKYGSSQGARKK
jgi:hypothetical protein